MMCAESKGALNIPCRLQPFASVLTGKSLLHFWEQQHIIQPTSPCYHHWELVQLRQEEVKYAQSQLVIIFK